MPQMPSAKSLPAFIVLAVALILGGLAGCATAPPPLPPVIVEPPPPPPPPPEEAPEIDARRFAQIDQVAKEEIAAGHIPGAVILVGHHGKTVYRKAFGLRALTPRSQPMKVDTIFDLASLTKVVATTTAIMELVDRGQINLDKPAATYWPAFAANGKGAITIRQLLTHTSGFARPGCLPSPTGRITTARWWPLPWITRSIPRGRSSITATSISSRWARSCTGSRTCR